MSYGNCIMFFFSFSFFKISEKKNVLIFHRPFLPVEQQPSPWEGRGERWARTHTGGRSSPSLTPPVCFLSKPQTPKTFFN